MQSETQGEEQGRSNCNSNFKQRKLASLHPVGWDTIATARVETIHFVARNASFAQWSKEGGKNDQFPC